jgi:hypothetical protein
MGKDQTSISGLRFQKNDNGEVHIHDDQRKLKLEMKGSDFKAAAEDALKQFKNNEGAIKIDGCGADLVLLKENDNINFMLVNNTNNENELTTFLRTL